MPSTLLSPEQIVTCGYMALNFFTSVSIIWANKLAYNAGFQFATSLTVIHFMFTFFGLTLSIKYKLFEHKPLAILQVLPISIAFCGFVVFNNLSLQTNSIGTYQLFKVLTTPTIVAIQFCAYKTSIPLPHAISLLPVCLGVVLATVTSVDTNLRGSIFGFFGILSTSVYQIWVKTEQSRLNCSSEQLLLYQAPVSAIMLLILMPLVEDTESLLSFKWISLESVFWTFLSSILAFLVNLSIFLVIGRTSPVSYNVLGHGKLCIILLSGYLIFGDAYSIKNLIGVLMAICGIVWYTHLKLQPATPEKPEKNEEEKIPIIPETDEEYERE